MTSLCRHFSSKSTLVTLYRHVNKEITTPHVLVLATSCWSARFYKVSPVQLWQLVYLKRWLPRNTFGAVQTSHQHPYSSLAGRCSKCYNRAFEPNGCLKEPTCPLEHSCDDEHDVRVIPEGVDSALVLQQNCDTLLSTATDTNVF